MLVRRFAVLGVPLALVIAAVPASANTRAPVRPPGKAATHTVNVGQGGLRFVDQDAGSGSTTRSRSATP
jgi:hypothetical protein